MFQFSHYTPQSGRLFSLHVAFFFSVCEYLWPQRTLAGAHNWVPNHPTAAKSSWSPWGPQRAVWAHRTLWKIGHLADKAKEGPERPSRPTSSSHRWRMRKGQASFPTPLKWGKFKTLLFATDFCFLTFLSKAETSPISHTHFPPTPTSWLPQSQTRKSPSYPLCCQPQPSHPSTVSWLSPNSATLCHSTSSRGNGNICSYHKLCRFPIWFTFSFPLGILLLWTIERALSQLVWPRLTLLQDHHLNTNGITAYLTQKPLVISHVLQQNPKLLHVASCILSNLATT